MDVISQLLLYFDGLSLSWMKKNRRFIDSYYDLVTPISETTLRMKNGSFVSVLRLNGVVALLNPREKLEISTKIVQDLNPYFTKMGFTFQVVDWNDPEINERRIRATMRDSIEELKRMGLDDPIFNEDYVKFVAGKSKWQEQCLVLITNPVALDKTPGDESPITPSELDLIEAKELFIKHGLRVGVNEQGLFLSDDDIKLLAVHEAFAKRSAFVLNRHGFLVSQLTVKRFLRLQREILWSAAGTTEDWEPNLKTAVVTKQNQVSANNRSRIKLGEVPPLVLTEGAELDASGLNVVKMGGRYFRTLNLVLPQNVQERLLSYEDLVDGIKTKTGGYIISYRLDSEPFKFGEFKTNRAYAMMCSILPYSNNPEIKAAHDEIMRRHKTGEPSVFFQMTITVYAKTRSELDAMYAEVSSAADGWGQASFNAVEIDPLDGVFASVPAVTALPRLTQVLEDAATTLYMSPLFVDCRLYEQGYLHFFTKTNRPFPLEEHSSKNINFNNGAFGAPGTGKSTLLTMQNIAFLAKPKIDAQLQGEFPLIFNLDFGQTSFGLNETLKELLLERAKKTNDKMLAAKSMLFLNHNMGTSAESAWNPHDLPIGRTMPTARHKTMLAGFLQLLLFGASKNPANGQFVFAEEGIAFLSMLENMVDGVYKYRHPTDTPYRFDMSEFSVFPQHDRVIEFMRKMGILKPGEAPEQAFRFASYYDLSVDLMVRATATKNDGNIRLALYYAKVLRRFAYPRLSDYVEILGERSSFKQLYGTKLKTFQEKITDSIQRYPCFNSVSRIEVDMARVISIDIDSVVGDDVNRKALFGSMAILMYLVKRENDFESADLFDASVQEVFMPHLQQMNRMNRRMPSIFNLEEAHILMRLFDEVLCSYQRRNRKVNWGLKSFSQNLDDPTPEFLSLCSTIFITSNMSTKAQAEILKNDLRLSQRNQEYVSSQIGDDPKNFFVVMRTKSPGSGDEDDSSTTKKNPPVAIPLSLHLPPAFLWASTADAVDREFKLESIKRYGFSDALRMLSHRLTKGSVKYLLESSDLRTLVAQQRKPDGTAAYNGGVFEFLLEYLSMPERPQWLPRGIL